MVVARIAIDFLQNPIKFDATFAFICTRTNRTPAFANAQSGLWSPTTMEKLKELCASMEADMARAVLVGGATSSVASPKSGLAPEGLGEHVGAPVDAPSV
jgi:cobalamin-dependent methionine synthase I